MSQNTLDTSTWKLTQQHLDRHMVSIICHSGIIESRKSIFFLKMLKPAIDYQFTNVNVFHKACRSWVFNIHIYACCSTYTAK